MDLVELIKKYYNERKLKWPSFDEAMKFVVTELAEVYELDLARIGGFVRNHPETKEEFSKERLSEELGDAIFMLLVAGYVEGVNPIESMKAKMCKKLGITIPKEGILVDIRGYTTYVDPVTGITNVIIPDDTIAIQGDGVAQWWLDFGKSIDIKTKE